MKKTIATLLCAGLLSAAPAAWAYQECYTLSGGTFFAEEGDMHLILSISAPSGGGQVLKVTGKGVNASHDPNFFHGAAKISDHAKEFSLKGSGFHIYTALFTSYSVSVMYDYHLTLSPGDSGWTGKYAGEIHTSEGEEQDVGGAVTEVSCP
jgi:hypothetical protein